MSPAPEPDHEAILAGGAVISAPRKRVLLVHRPTYDDWSFPQRKADPGEHDTAAADRAVRGETGLHVRLGVPLPTQRYPVRVGGRTREKVVHYWAARVVGDDDISGYRPNDEIDAVAWVPHDEARERLTHEHDRLLLDRWYPLRKRTRTLLVLRHAKAMTRSDWDAPDRNRPLEERGSLDAHALVPVLAAYGIERVISSPSRRCADTVTPYADATGIEVEWADALSEEGASRAGVEAIVADALDAEDRAIALCTHRPVLPRVMRALDQPYEPLDPAGLLVVHHRTNSRGVRTVVAVEQHTPRA